MLTDTSASCLSNGRSATKNGCIRNSVAGVAGANLLARVFFFSTTGLLRPGGDSVDRPRGTFTVGDPGAGDFTAVGTGQLGHDLHVARQLKG